MHKIKNASAGPRGITAGGETIMLEPGEERELDVQAGDLKVAKASGWFGIDGKEPEAGASDTAPSDNPATTAPPAGTSTDRFDAMSDDDLRAFIEDRDGKAPHANSKRETLLAKARE